MFSFFSPIVGGLWQLMQHRAAVGAALTIMAVASIQQARLLAPEKPIEVLNQPAVTVTTTAREANAAPEIFEISVAGTPTLALQTEEVALSRETILTRMSIASNAEEMLKRAQKRRDVRSETFEVPPMHASSPELASFLEKIGLGKEGEVLAMQNGVPTWINGRALSYMPGERTAPPSRDSNGSGSSGRGGGGGGSTTNTTVNTTIVNESNGWTDGENVIYLTTDTDKVGIGTDTPSTKLEVAGTLSGSLLTLSGLANCDSIDTDADGNLVCGTDDGGDSFDQNLNVADTPTFDGLELTATLSGTLLNLSGLTNCDSIDTDANGNLICGTDAGGIGSLSLDFTDGSNTETLVDGDTVTFTGDGDIGVTLSNDGSNAVTLAFLNGSGFITAGSTETLSNKSGDISMWTNNLGYITAASTDTLSNKTGDISMWTNNLGFITADSADTLSNKTGDISMWTNNALYITNGEETDQVYNANTFAVDMDQNVGSDDSPTFNSVTITTDIITSSADCTFIYTNNLGHLACGDAVAFAALETDPVYNANTFAVDMDQNVGTDDGPTFGSLTLSGILNCDSLDTDGLGNLNCGTDDGG